MKKLLAVLLCMGLICGMGSGLVGCSKPAPTKDKDAKDKDAKDKKDKAS